MISSIGIPELDSNDTKLVQVGIQLVITTRQHVLVQLRRGPAASRTLRGAARTEAQCRATASFPLPLP
jgi:hypothetical protein